MIIKKYQRLFFLLALFLSNNISMAMQQNLEPAHNRLSGISQAMRSCWSAFKYHVSRCMRSSCRSLKRIDCQDFTVAACRIGTCIAGAYLGADQAHKHLFRENSTSDEIIVLGLFGAAAGCFLANSILIIITSGSLKKLLYALRSTYDFLLQEGLLCRLCILNISLICGSGLAAGITGLLGKELATKMLSRLFVACFDLGLVLNTIAFVVISSDTISSSISQMLNNSMTLLFQKEPAVGAIERDRVATCTLCRQDFDHVQRVACSSCSSSLHNQLDITYHDDCLRTHFLRGDNTCSVCSTPSESDNHVLAWYTLLPVDIVPSTKQIAHVDEPEPLAFGLVDSSV